MTPLLMWAGVTIGSAIYHGTKQYLGFPPSWDLFWCGTYWFGIAMLCVWIGWVKT
jgi:hypothetical protein